ncbi:MAG: hypothetical protein LBG96_13540 [Tannerella sp.]|jgi:hypothetical protein|nr:hypothetical protein [Tannerella sp.]
MGKEKPKVQSILESVFINAVDKLSKADRGHFVGELHIQLDMLTGEIQVYDDQEVLLEKNIIFDWAADRSERGARSHKQAVHLIRGALAALKSRKIFDNPVFMWPLTILLVDDNFNEIEMIYMLEDVDFVSEGRLMKNMEQELQIFSKKLFADME